MPKCCLVCANLAPTNKGFKTIKVVKGDLMNIDIVARVDQTQVRRPVGWDEIVVVDGDVEPFEDLTDEIDVHVIELGSRVTDLIVSISPPNSNPLIVTIPWDREAMAYIELFKETNDA